MSKTSLTIRNAKGNKDRQTLLSQSCTNQLDGYIQRAIKIQQQDNQHRVGPSLPHSLAKKYPNAYSTTFSLLLHPIRLTATKKPNSGTIRF
ncbi:hypothetical protein TUM3792_05120 [Shewanella sp. MBTL60-007]|nr:hypothetical protein TUM3792_05120 [Shewanella sp. MBTL60-007]